MNKPSAFLNACAMLVKPFRCVSPSIADFTAAMSLVSGRISFASAIVPSSSTSPLPNCTTPVFMSWKPWYVPWYLSTSFDAQPLMISKPASRTEPLPSMARMRSCLAMQISSPAHGCGVHDSIRRRQVEPSLGHSPFPRMGTTTWRHFSWKPPSHATEHGDQSVQGASSQSRSQDCVLHGTVSMTVLQDMPPFIGFTRMVRVRDLVPPPHSSLVHAENRDHSDSTQSTGHLICEHFRLRSSAGHW